MTKQAKVLIALYACCATTVHAQQYSITGQIVNSAVGGIYETKAEFKVLVNNCNVEIEWKPIEMRRNGEKIQAPYGQKLTYIGGEYYVTTDVSGVNLEGGSSMHVTSAVIGDAEVPYGIRNNNLMALWYAYGSRCYLRKDNGGYLYPIADYQDRGKYAGEFKEEVEIEKQEGMDYLPRKITYYRKSESGKKIVRSIYEVLKSIKIGNYEYPEEFEVTVYKENVTGDNPIVAQKYTCANVRVEPITGGGDIKKPELARNMNTLVDDMRVVTKATPDGARVEVSTNWPSEYDSQEIAKIVRAGQEALGQKGYKENFAMKIVLGMLVVSVPAYYIVKKLNK